MKNIVLIGAGELGSRHLQSLINLGNRARITVLEPTQSSIDVAKIRAQEISSVLSNSADVDFVKNMTDLPESIDLCIIATGAAPRLGIIKSLLQHATVKYLVLEKVLFQSVIEYQTASELLEQAGTQTWVNCPRRMFAGYSELKFLLNAHAPIKMTVSGGGWGLACNAIHFIDIFAFLTDDKVVSVSNELLEPQISPSKRAGYIEIFGILTIKFASGHSLVLECLDTSASINIEIFDIENHFSINESNGEIKKNNNLIDTSVGLKYQSQLSEIVAKQLLCYGHAEITSLAESSQLHIPYIESLLTFYNKMSNSNITVLPIT